MANELEKKMGVEMLPKLKIDLPDQNEDFMAARENLIQVIADCDEAIEKLKMIADQSEHARYYEVLAAYLKQKTEASEKLLKLQKDITDLNQKGEGAQPKKVVNQLFVGSSAELLKAIKDATKKD